MKKTTYAQTHSSTHNCGDIGGHGSGPACGTAAGFAVSPRLSGFAEEAWHWRHSKAKCYGCAGRFGEEDEGRWREPYAGRDRVRGREQVEILSRCRSQQRSRGNDL